MLPSPLRLVRWGTMATMRICLAYDCLYPWTVGGAERWYRGLGERLASEGHEVTYLTRLQWQDADQPQIPGVRVIAVSGSDELYGADGNRRIGPPLRFGLGVLIHLLRHGRSYDVVHLCSFPYFSVLAAAAARPLGRYRLIVDWFEVWSPEYWRGYLGPIGGRIGHAVQRLCVRLAPQALCFSRLFSARLVAEGLRGVPRIVGGLYDGELTPPLARHAEAVVVFAGRHIAEKRAPAVVAAIARVRERGVDVRGVIFGDGPQRSMVLSEIAKQGLEGIVTAPGFVDRAEIERVMSDALCLVHPSSREGYGLVVVEATAHGTPVVLVAGRDNAAVELIEAGVNGIVAPSSEADDLADAILAIDAAGYALRESTCAWFGHNAERLSLARSLEEVVDVYGRKIARA